MALALFLSVASIILLLDTKKSVKADTIALTDNFYLKTANPTGNLGLSGNVGGTFNDSNNQRLVFYIPLENYINVKYFVARYIFTYSSNQLNILFYQNTTQDLDQAPIFNIVLNYKESRYNSAWIFGNIASTFENITPFFYDIINALNNGFYLATRVDNGSGQMYGSTNILDNESYTYLFLTTAFKYAPVEDLEGQAFDNGVNSVLENPSNYNLFTMDELDNAFYTGYDRGYDAGELSGFNEGYDEGRANPDAFKFDNIVNKTFNSAKGILTMDLIGPLKLIHFILIPLLLGLFAIILKVFRS